MYNSFEKCRRWSSVEKDHFSSFEVTKDLKSAGLEPLCTDRSLVGSLGSLVGSRVEV